MTSIIRTESLSKNYESGGKAIASLEDISLSIDQGDIYGIIGLSGAGKSTLIRSLARLIIPTSGKILFHGNDIANMGKHELRTFRKKIGMIFQHFNLLSSRSVAGNIAYPLEIADVPQNQQNDRVNALLGFVGLKEKQDAYPARLSGGEKQRVGIARALANHPEVLLCDEATSALDPKTTKEILALLKGVNIEFGVTIVLITHEMEVIKQICNKVAVLDKGHIVEQGNVSDIFADPQHKITKNFLQRSTHEIPTEFIKPANPNRKLLRLTFKGRSAEEAVISEMVRKFDVNTNILLGWIDRLQTVTIGTLVIELTGSVTGMDNALTYLQTKAVHFEEIENGK